jgi:hypothetical protein
VEVVVLGVWVLLVIVMVAMAESVIYVVLLVRVHIMQVEEVAVDTQVELVEMVAQVVVAKEV